MRELHWTLPPNLQGMLRWTALAAFLLLLPLPAFGQLQIFENTTKQALDAGAAADLYHRVVQQMEMRRLRVANKPLVFVHLHEKKEVEKALRQCVEEGCAHVLRVGNGGAKDAPLVFLAISQDGVKVWTDNPHPVLLAKAVTVALDYENRLYLGPVQVRDIAETAATVARVSREGTVSVNALRAQQ